MIVHVSPWIHPSHICHLLAGALLVREACALAVLQGCPQIIRYFGCWLDNHHLYIKTELCHLGTLEDLISLRPNPSSIIGMLMMHRKNNNNNYNNSSHPLQSSSSSGSSRNHHHRKSSNRSDSYDDSCGGEDNMNLLGDGGYDSYIDRDQQQHQHQLLASSELSNELTVSYHDDIPIDVQPRRGVREELAWLVLFEMSCALKYIHERGTYVSMYLSICVCMYLSNCLCICICMYLSICVCIEVPVYPSIYLFYELWWLSSDWWLGRCVCRPSVQWGSLYS